MEILLLDGPLRGQLLTITPSCEFKAIDHHLRYVQVGKVTSADDERTLYLFATTQAARLQRRRSERGLGLLLTSDDWDAIEAWGRKIPWSARVYSKVGRDVRATTRPVDFLAPFC